MKDISSKCKELASNSHHGTVGKMLLAEEFKHTGHAPNDTRWDTRHQNMSDVLYHERCLLSLAEGKEGGRTSLYFGAKPRRVQDDEGSMLKFCWLYYNNWLLQ